MQHTYSSITRYLSESDHVVLLWNEEDTLSMEESGTYISLMSLFVVTSGRLVLRSDCNVWEASAGDVMFFAYDREVRILSMSPDYRSKGAFFSRSYWNDTLMDVNSSLYAAKLYPVIHVKEGLRNVLTDFIDELYSLRDRGKAEYDPLFVHCLVGLFYHLGKTYERSIRNRPADSGIRLLVDFAALLSVNWKVRRDVPFYAEGLHLSRSRFSSRILEITGVTAGYAIRRYVVLKICHLLKDSQKSVKEISLDLNFGSPSNFCKFFRDQMGVTPEEYRQDYRRRLNQL